MNKAFQNNKSYLFFNSTTLATSKFMVKPTRTMDPRTELRTGSTVPVTPLQPQILINKAGYTATPVACGWAGVIIEVFPSFGQEQ